MNYKSIIYTVLLLFFTTYSCTNKDEEERLFPKVKTLEVSNITDEGAVFNGLIEGVLSNKNITDHGFFYGFPDEKAPLGYTKISLGKLDGNTNSFHTQVSSDLLKDQTYMVIAYIEASNRMIYGPATSFISKGGLGPEIKSFRPQVAGWGDTIKISGKNFSAKMVNNIVKFDQVKATIVSASDSVLRVIVPVDLSTQKSAIGIITAEKTVMAMQPFQIGKPVIKSLTAKVPFGGILTIKTQNIKGKLAYFYIDGIQITSTQVSLNEYNLVVPKTYNYGSHTLKITLFGENAEGSFHYDAPYISGFSPKQVGWNDKLTIIGKNFKSLPSKAGIDFLGSNCGTSIFSVLNDSVIQLKVPHCTVPLCKVGIFTDYFKLYSSQQLSINGPELQPLSNNQFCVGDHIILEGKRIYSYGTLHCFDGVCEEVAPSFIDSTHLEFDLPVTLGVGVHRLTLKIGQLQSNPIEFYIKKLTVNSIVEDFSCRYGKITLLGENFARLSYQNVVKIGGVQAEVVSRNEKSIQVRLPVSASVNSSSDVVVSVGQQQVIVPDKVEIIEPWEKVSEFGAGFSAGAKFTIGNKFYFSTGSMDNGDFYCYNSDNNTWKKISEYPGGRVMVPICFVIGQYAYVGLGDKASPQKFWKYDSVSDRWDEIAECPLNVSSVGWDANKNMGFAFVNGQYGYVGNTPSGLYKYDSVNNRWISCKWHDTHYSTVSVNVGINNNTTCFHIYGSSNPYYGSNIFLNEYNPISDSWKFSESTYYFFTKDMFGATYIEKLNRFLFDGFIMHSTRPSGIQYFDFSSNKKGFFFPSISPGATLFSTEDGRLFSMTFDENLNKLILYKFNFDKYEQVKTIVDDY